MYVKPDTHRRRRRDSTRRCVLGFRIGVRAQSTVRGTLFLPETYVLKISKMPEFYMIPAREIIKIPEFLYDICPKIYKIPEFYMIFARKMSEFYIIIARKNIFPEF